METPAYRGDKMGTTLNLLPDLLQGHRGAQLAAQVDGTRIEAPQALLVANDPYGTEDLAGLSRRTRLDGGILGVVGRHGEQRRAGRRPAPRHPGRRSQRADHEAVEITANAPQIPVGVDGESILMSTPVTCTVSPGALRVWVPRERPAVPAPKPAVDWARLRQLAGAGARLPRSRCEDRCRHATGFGDAARRAGDCRSAPSSST